MDTVRKEQDRINKDFTVKLGEISKQKDILSEQLHSKIKELERSHAAAVTSLEGENNDLNDQKQEMTQRIATLETESSLLTAELNDAKKSAIQEQEQLSVRVASLESDLLEARQCTAAKEAEVIVDRTISRLYKSPLLRSQSRGTSSWLKMTLCEKRLQP